MAAILENGRYSRKNSKLRLENKIFVFSAPKSLRKKGVCQFFLKMPYTFTFFKAGPVYFRSF